jgi:5'-nucleotidase (lipoprotein e(P4) family)
MRFVTISILSLLVSSSALAQDSHWKRMQCSPGTTLLNAVLWVQNSAEYKASARMVYANATRALDDAIKDKSWSALGQTGVADRPLAVILDLDETAISNVPFEARSIRAGVTYSQLLWDEWVASASAPAIPGAAAFLETARKRSVTPFYITNRRSVESGKITENLNRIGFPVLTVLDEPGSTTDNLLLRGDKKEWSEGDKTPRREWVAQRYRVVLLLGDDLNDFISTTNKSEAERDDLVAQHGDDWGTRWFILPNPMYGSWQNAALTRTPTGATRPRGPQDGCEEVEWRIEATRP